MAKERRKPIITFLLNGLLIGVSLAGIAAWITLNFHNISVFSPVKSFDGKDHIQYIEFIRTEKILPLPAQGWEMYHPPLFYLLMSFFPNHETAQYFNFILVLAVSLLVFLFLRKKYGDFRYGILGVIFSLSLPAILTAFPQVNSEILLMVLVNTGLAYYFFHQKKLTRTNCIVIGVIAGLVLLTKYTGIVFLVAVTADILLHRIHTLRSSFRPVAIIVVTAFFLSGWLYTRNMLLYKNPLVSNIDIFPTRQVPSFRDADFVINTSAFVTADLRNANYYSLWGGIYFSFFHDMYNVIIPNNAIDTSDPGLITRPIGILLLIFSGLLYTVFKKGNDRIFTLYFLLLLASFIYYCYKYPTSTSVKGIYLISSILPLCVFGLNLARKYRINIYVLCGYVLLYFWVIYQNFRI